MIWQTKSLHKEHRAKQHRPTKGNRSPMSKWHTPPIETAKNIADYAQNLVNPSLKLGVTGLSRAGKTVFITSLIYHLLNRQNLPFFEPLTSGRLIDAYLEPHPDDLWPRFNYEGHLEKLTNTAPSWPEGTKQISQLRLTLVYQSDKFPQRLIGPSKLHIDIIDYPGEWLLDLPLMQQDYESWSTQALEFAKKHHTHPAAASWLQTIEETNPTSPSNEGHAKQLSDHFRTFLQTIRNDTNSRPTLPPGRFLMPGDLEGAPALTFAPLPSGANPISSDSLVGLMKRRFEAYKDQIVAPFYYKFFTRLDRQIILVDALAAINSGPEEIQSLKHCLSEILKSFNPGASHWLTSIWNKKIDRLVFAATKADHLHHHNPDQPQNHLSHHTHEAIKTAELKGAEVKVQALAALKTTTEIEVEKNGETFKALKGTPLKGEQFQGQTFDGQEPILFFPGELPENSAVLFKNSNAPSNSKSTPAINIVKFAPPTPEDGQTLPHIRLDRALNMLIGDQLQ